MYSFPYNIPATAEYAFRASTSPVAFAYQLPINRANSSGLNFSQSFESCDLRFGSQFFHRCLFFLFHRNNKSFPVYSSPGTKAFPKYTHFHSSPGRERIAGRKSSAINGYAYHPHRHRWQYNIIITKSFKSFFNIQACCRKLNSSFSYTTFLSVQNSSVVYPAN